MQIRYHKCGKIHWWAKLCGFQEHRESFLIKNVDEQNLQGLAQPIFPCLATVSFVCR